MANRLTMRFLASCFLVLLFFAACANEAEPDPVSQQTAEPEPPPPQPLTFAPYRYDDSTALRPHGPYFTYGLQTLRAQGGNPALRRLINDTLTAVMLEFVPPDRMPLDTAVRLYLNPLFDDYREQEVQEEWLQEAPNTFSRQQQEETELLYRNDSLVVLVHQYYEYTGGAHGMHYTTLLPFAVEPPRFLTYDDLFPAGMEDTLSSLLMAKAMENPEQIFGDSLPVTRNVAPLPGGVRFLYDPYAIGPYSSGEIALDLPYGELEGILRPGVAELVKE